MTDTGRTIDEGQAPLPGSRHRLARLALDPASVKRGNANIEHEREVAIFDILEANEFELLGRDDGPYDLVIGVQDDRLVFTVTPDVDGGGAGGTPAVLTVTLVPLRKVMKDYFLDEGAKALAERLADRVRLDTTTARRLFTLICALHWRG
jgi:uncharacterized protein (UPF0262 family)